MTIVELLNLLKLMIETNKLRGLEHKKFNSIEVDPQHEKQIIIHWEK